MNSRSQFIKECIMDSIANDYEDFEMVVSETNKFTAEKNIKASRQEIYEGLRELIASGYAQAYVLSSQPPYSQVVGFSADRLGELWYYVTEKGKERLKQMSEKKA